MSAQAMKEAAIRLRNDETLQSAFDMARQRALNSLATVDATDSAKVIALQAEVAAIQRIRDELANLIIAAPRDQRAVR